MLTDIFANRYLKTKIWDAFADSERRLIVQGFRILLDQLRPYYDLNGKIDASGKAFWQDLQSRMSMELGLDSLSPVAYAFNAPSGALMSGMWEYDYVCKNWMLLDFDPRARITADRFVKERISLIEIGFRRCGEDVAASNAALPDAIESARERRQRSTGRLVLPGDPGDYLIETNKGKNILYSDSVTELNERFRQAETRLHYHNGFVQLADDALSTEKIEAPFWEMVADPKWRNVDLEMKEAIDHRDNGLSDAPFHAAKALESTIKIISNDRNLSTGKERGAANYIDNLIRGSLIGGWEADALKAFFAKVRNPMGHGAGDSFVHTLNPAQTDFVIETCMSWSKTLIRRL
jgi:AbiJ N-terminal domain 4